MGTKELIFNTALKLFALHGYDGTSIRMICGEVGISESSLYNHFKGKKELLSAILVKYNDMFDQTSPSVAERQHLADTLSLREVLFYLVNKFIAFWETPNEHLSIWQILSSEHYKNKDAGMIIINETAKRIERITATFDWMQSNQKMLPCNSQLIAMNFVYSIRSQYFMYTVSKLYLPDSQHYIESIYQTVELFADVYEKE